MVRRLVAVSVFAFASVFLGAAQGASPGVGSYIVVLKSGTDSVAVAAKHKQRYGAEVSHVYKHALKGYAAKLAPQGVAAAQADPDVLFVSEDRELTWPLLRRLRRPRIRR